MPMCVFNICCMLICISHRIIRLVLTSSMCTYTCLYKWSPPSWHMHLLLIYSTFYLSLIIVDSLPSTHTLSLLPPCTSWRPWKLKWFFFGYEGLCSFCHIMCKISILMRSCINRHWKSRYYKWIGSNVAMHIQMLD